VAWFETGAAATIGSSLRAIHTLSIECHFAALGIIGDENTGGALPSSRARYIAMATQHRFKKFQKLEKRLAKEALRLREEVRNTPAGAEREKLIRRAERAEAAWQMSEWLRSPGLRPLT
jgi:hypothetical protein